MKFFLKHKIAQWRFRRIKTALIAQSREPLSEDSRRRLLTGLFATGAVLGTAGSAAALVPTPLLPTLLGSGSPGQFPGDGTYRALQGLEKFVGNDGTFAWQDATGVQRHVSLADLRTPAYFGAKGDGVTDDTAALNAFFASGKGYIAPTSSFYAVLGVLSLPSGGAFVGPPTAIIRKVLPSGAAVTPLLITDRWSNQAMNITLTGGVTFDHNAAALSDPASGDPAGGACIIWRAGYSTVNITVKNGWDNGILVADYDYATDTFAANNAGTPPGVVFANGRSFGCGCGNHTKGALLGKNGAGIDLADAGGFAVIGWIDYGSAGAIGTDTGGGAFGEVVGCVSNTATLDTANPLNGSGLGFVTQSRSVAFSACISFFAQRNAFVAFGTVESAGQEAGADGCSFVSCNGFYSGQETFLICAPKVSLSGCHAYAASRASRGTYNGFTVRATFCNVTGVTLAGCSATDLPDATGTYAGVPYMLHEYGEYTSTSGSYGNGNTYVVSATIVGGFNPLNISTQGNTTYLLESALSVSSITTNSIVLGGVPISHDNLLDNGNFLVKQNGYASGTALAAGAYGHDRWKAGGGGCTYTFTQASSAENGATHSPDTTITITSGYLQQDVPASRIVGGTYTLSWAGTAQAIVQYYDGSQLQTPAVGASPLTFVLPAGCTVTVSIGSPSTGTCGTIQLERGSVATPFQRRDPQVELGRCLAFNWTQTGLSIGMSPREAGTPEIYRVAYIPFPVPMRAAPSVTVTSSNSAMTFGYTATPYGVSIFGTGSAGDTTSATSITSIAASADI